MKLWACYTVANEAALLAESMRSVKAYVDGYVVIDSLFETNPAPGTHSTDGTFEIAHKHAQGRLLYYHESRVRLNEPRARNLYLDATLGDWVLIIDGDELLLGDWGPTMALVDELRAGQGPSAIHLAVYTMAVNVNGMAPDVTPEAYDHAPLISTVGYQPRLVHNASSRQLRYRVDGLGIGHGMYDGDGRHVGEATSRIEHSMVILNQHTRQPWAGYQADYAWERGAIDQALAAQGG